MPADDSAGIFFTLPTPMAPNFEFSVPFLRWADTVRVPCGGAGAVRRRLYDHEWVYVLEGAGEIVLDGVSHPAKPDSLFLVQPGVWHSFLSPRQEQRLLGVHFDWRTRPDTARFPNFFAVDDQFDPELTRPRESLPNWNDRPFLNLAGRPRARKMLEEVVAEYHRGDANARTIAGALLVAMMGQIEREIRLLGEMARHPNVGADAVRRVQRARELLENGENPLSVEAVAQKVGWSGDHLRRMTRAVLGVAPLELQRAAQVRRAQELLRYGGLSVAEIGRRCGFCDASHFVRVFRVQTGLTPRQWLVLARGQR